MSRGRKATLHGITFDSQVELQRYLQLYGMAQHGDISDLVCHPKFELARSFMSLYGKRVGGAVYTADFQYIENGVTVVEDVKATKKNGKPLVDGEASLRHRWFQNKYPHIDFRVVPM